MKISVAFPVFNEAEVLPLFISTVKAVLEKCPGGPHEMLAVDDGSTDASASILIAEAKTNPHFKSVILSRNFGHQAALSAALDHVAGDIVIVMDADMQDDPSCIPMLAAKVREGFDIVSAQRIGRKENVLLRACYFSFYRLLQMLSPTPLPTDTGDFSALSRRTVEALKQLRESSPYLRGLRSWVGFKQTSIPIERASRAAGKSKYSLRRLIKLAFDGIFSFTLIPIRMVSLIGFCAIAAAMLFGIYALYVRFALHKSPEGFTMLFFSMTFLSGIQLLFLGVVGEYIGRIYEETKKRPRYIIGDTFNVTDVRR